MYFSENDASGNNTYSDGGLLYWPNYNRLTWSKIVYDISGLGWEIGERYSLEFKYKGHIDGDAKILMGYSLSNLNQCNPKNGNDCPTVPTKFYECAFREGVTDLDYCCYYPDQEYCYQGSFFKPKCNFREYI